MISFLEKLILAVAPAALVHWYDQEQQNAVVSSLIRVVEQYAANCQ